ncbi:MAG: hypothetical protein IPO60_07655 [Flavobacteriales bacterium]|nr:hypothetical protein [Flavobacteriales bacterium]
MEGMRVVIDHPFSEGSAEAGKPFANDPEKVDKNDQSILSRRLQAQWQKVFTHGVEPQRDAAVHKGFQQGITAVKRKLHMRDILIMVQHGGHAGPARGEGHCVRIQGLPRHGEWFEADEPSDRLGTACRDTLALWHTAKMA